MTKEDVENVVKRYPQITDAIKQDLRCAVFYVGNRKNVVEITDNIKAVCEIITTVYEKQKNDFIRQMIEDILMGISDVRIIQDMPFERNTYYNKKQAFLEKIYNCCIARDLVSYEDVLNEEIAL